MQNNEYLRHAGKKGMKWGYNDGVRNGKRVASGVSEALADIPDRARREFAIARMDRFTALYRAETASLTIDKTAKKFVRRLSSTSLRRISKSGRNTVRRLGLHRELMRNMVE